MSLKSIHLKSVLFAIITTIVLSLFVVMIAMVVITDSNKTYVAYYEAGYKQAIHDMENSSKHMFVQNKINSDEILHLKSLQ